MSGSNAYSPARDMTAKQPASGGGMDMRLQFMCGPAHAQHKGYRAGSLMRGRIPMRCAACVAKDKA